MKTRIATLLSLAGVLTAGSAAALVNTKVLDSNASGNDTAVVAPTTSTVPASTVPVIAVDAGVGALAGQTQSSFAVGDAGVVVLDTAGNVLTLVSTTPNAGWQVVKAESSSPTEIEVRLQSATIEIEFHASLVDGSITTSVGARELASSAMPANGSYDDDDDDSYDDHDDSYDDDHDDDRSDDDD